MIYIQYLSSLGVTTKRKTRRKQCKKGSVKASRPNEIWHADVTEFTTSDNVKFYVQISLGKLLLTPLLVIKKQD